MRGSLFSLLLALALCVVAALAPGRAEAQSAQEPVDLGETLVVLRGPIPFLPTAELDPAVDPRAPQIDESGWQSRRIPDVGSSPGWYRLHLRQPTDSPGPQAVALPPVYGVWELALNGVRIAGDGLRVGEEDREARPARERWTIVPLDPSLLRPGRNLLALSVQSWEGLAGLGGPLRLGPVAAVRGQVERGRVLALGLALALLALGVFATALAATDRADRFPLLLALSLLTIGGYAATNNDAWYYVFSDTELKFSLRHAFFFLLHPEALFIVQRLFAARGREAVGVLSLLALVLALCALLAPMGATLELARYGAVLTFVCIGYALWLGRSLPVRSLVVRAGVRASFVGLLLALLFEVATGTWRSLQAGPFEIVFLLMLASVAGVFVLTQARAQRRAVSVLRSSRDGLVVTDLSGRPVYANPAVLAMLRADASRLEAEGLAAWFGALDGHHFPEAVSKLGAAAVGEGLPPRLLELPGQGVAVDMVAVRLDDLHLLFSLRDVTDRRRLEREVARAQRLDSLGMLAGGIAHDFNNLLAGVLLNATELEQEGPESGPWRPRLAAITEAARRGAALTQRLLQFARGHVGPAAGVDLQNELPDMLDMLGRTLGRNLEWSIEIEAGLPTVSLDQTGLEQILINLCVNARDAMGPGGGRVSVRARREGDSVRLEIGDDGPGIAPELLPRVVEPFVTTKGSGAGTGLGLAVVHGVVTARGGQMEIASQPGQGTTVTLTLPTQPATPRPAAPPAEAPRALGAQRILLVDDEAALRSFLEAALAKRGLRVHALPDGAAVLLFIEEHRDALPVDAVVMDMMMPGVDGMEASEALREAFPGLPIIISSGYTGRETIQPLLDTGPTLLLEKPYQVDDLLRALAQVTRPGG